jgi:hypothetical protein
MNESHEKAAQRRKLALDRAAKLRRDDFIRAAVLHHQGREYLYWLLELCGIGRNPFTANALTTAFSCGELNVGQQIQAHLIEVAPNAFLEMLAEKEKERLNDHGNDRPDSSDNFADGE